MHKWNCYRFKLIYSSIENNHRDKKKGGCTRPVYILINLEILSVL